MPAIRKLGGAKSEDDLIMKLTVVHSGAHAAQNAKYIDGVFVISVAAIA
jgi:hypothetical protein